jgi:UDP-glucose 4-epimerase
MAFTRFIRCALEDRPIEVFGDGEQTRDFTFVEDAVDASMAAAESEAVGLAINIGGGSRVTVNSAVAVIGDLLGRDLAITYSAAARGDVRHTAADTSLAASLLGYKSRVELRTGLAAQIEWRTGR